VGDSPFPRSLSGERSSNATRLAFGPSSISHTQDYFGEFAPETLADTPINITVLYEGSDPVDVSGYGGELTKAQSILLSSGVSVETPVVVSLPLSFISTAFRGPGYHFLYLFAATVTEGAGDAPWTSLKLVIPQTPSLNWPGKRAPQLGIVWVDPSSSRTLILNLSSANSHTAIEYRLNSNPWVALADRFAPGPSVSISIPAAA
jgi:hypothetical protein